MISSPSRDVDTSQSFGDAIDSRPRRALASASRAAAVACIAGALSPPAATVRVPRSPRTVRCSGWVRLPSGPPTHRRAADTSLAAALAGPTRRSSRVGVRGRLLEEQHGTD